MYFSIKLTKTTDLLCVVMIRTGNAIPRLSTTPTTKPHPLTPPGAPLPGVFPGESGRYCGDVLETLDG